MQESGRSIWKHVTYQYVIRKRKTLHLTEQLLNSNWTGILLAVEGMGWGLLVTEWGNCDIHHWTLFIQWKKLCPMYRSWSTQWPLAYFCQVPNDLDTESRPCMKLPSNWADCICRAHDNRTMMLMCKCNWLNLGWSVYSSNSFPINKHHLLRGWFHTK